MIPEPIHPAIVHFPVVFAVLLPVAALAALIAIRRGGSARGSWLPVLGVGAALVLSSWIALQTGEREEDRVEGVVAESAIHRHEENAELFVPLTVLSLLVAAGGLIPNRTGRFLRGATLVAALATAGAAYRVGHSGGELVYRYGAAAAWTSPSTLADLPEAGQGEEEQDEDRETRTEPDHR